MKKIAGIFALVFLVYSLSCHAMEALSPSSMEELHTFRIEVLQVTDIEPYQKSLDGFLRTLHDSGIVSGANLTVHRVKIDFDVEKGGFWTGWEYCFGSGRRQCAWRGSSRIWS